MRTRGIAARRELPRNPGTDGHFEAASPKFTKSVLMPYVMNGALWLTSEPPLRFDLLSDGQRLRNFVAGEAVVISKLVHRWRNNPVNAGTNSKLPTAARPQIAGTGCAIAREFSTRYGVSPHPAPIVHSAAP